jgi:ubiquinone/menaquinone biosynthesis C-methylase UbiE
MAGQTLTGTGDAEAIRLQAEEHPLIEDTPPTNAAEHCLRLMHLRAYDEAVGYADGRDVLDVGCNTGYGTVRFMPVARSVTGTDVSPKAIEAALARAVGGQPSFVLTEGGELPFDEASFDLVTNFQVLEHVPDAIAYLEGLRRVTRPGGTIVLATPNAATRLDPGMTPWNRFHVREYTAAELKELLERVFPRVRIRGMFGAATLYETEIRRVDAARQRLRRLGAIDAAKLAAASRPPRAQTALPAPVTGLSRRSAVRQWGRRIVPIAVRRWLRSVLLPSLPPAPLKPPAATVPPGPPAPVMDFETFLAFTVADLFYADHDLDRAMDLLAICEVGPAA